MNNLLVERLVERKKTNLYRTRQSSFSKEKKLLSFSSNDYLGLAKHPQIINSLKQATDDYGIGSGASHLLGGFHPTHKALEEALAAFTGYPRALVFSTGYMANLGAITALLNKTDLILQDRLNHASLIDAGKFCEAQFKRYLHCNINSLETHLEKTTNKNKLIVSDGVFSMDGDLAPLPKLITTAKQFNAKLLIDDSHGLGALGKNGGGISEHFAIKPNILVSSFGKAFGTFGAFIASNEIIIENLIQFARSYIYTTALPPAIAAATHTSLQLIQKESWRREKLSHLIVYFKKNATELSLKLLPSQTPIQPILLNDKNLVMQVHQKLLEHGIVVGAIRPPTVPPQQARLRITLNATHSEEQIDRLLEILSKLV